MTRKSVDNEEKLAWDLRRRAMQFGSIDSGTPSYLAT